MSTMYAVSLGLNLTALFILIILFIASLISGKRREELFRWFFFLSLSELISILLEIPVASMQGIYGIYQEEISKTVYWSGKIGDYIIFVFDALTMFAYIMYVYTYLKTKARVSKKPVYLILIFSVANIILATVSLFTQMYSEYDAFHNYQKNDLYWVSIIFPVLTQLTGIIMTLRHIKVLKPKEWMVLLTYQMVPFICNFFEVSVQDLWISRVGTAIMLLLMYITIQVDLMQRIQAQEVQLTQNRIAIMLSQIKPHFLYNSLTSINELCTENPVAQEAIVRFSEYLRGNMDSLTQHHLITFEKELTHVKQYLWLEQLRFGERLQVIYELKAEYFLLPPLVLQPIVENAVRHGITKKRSGGTVKIQTEETGTSWRIQVSDNGIGFNSHQILEDGCSHNGIENVRERLSLVCHGTLTVMSRPGVGTTVTIELPKEEENKFEYYSGR